MIRAPVLNTILNAAATARQVVLRRSAYREVLSQQSHGGGGGEAAAPSVLVLRDLASGPLWLRDCRRVRRDLRRALDAGDMSAAEALLAKLLELSRLGEVVAQIGGLRPMVLRGACLSRASKWYHEAIQEGLKKGAVVPGVTRGVPALAMLHVRVEASTMELIKREAEQRMKLTVEVQKGYQGSGYLHLEDDDLQGLTDEMKSYWASHFGSWAMWRKAKYKVPVGKDARDKIGSFCQNPTTRARIFEAYFAGFRPSVDEAALALLRTRKELAKRYGFQSWADYQLRPMAVANAAGAHELLERCWKDARPTLLPYLQRMESLGGASTGSASSRSTAREGQTTSRISHCDEAFFRALVTREADTWRLAEFLPAGGCLPRLLEVVGRAYNVHFQEVEKPETLPRLLSGWHKSVRIYAVRDGPPPASGPSATSPARLLGYVYVDLFQRQGFLERMQSALAGATLLCRGHAYVSMHLVEPGFGQNKLCSPEEVIGLAHEMGHAIHMLCHAGSPQDWDDMPIDVLELPSTLVETIALSPGAIAQYARHYTSGGPPPDSLVRSCQRDVYFFVRYLQNTHVSLGLHSEAFDPDSATPAELRRTAVSLWQRYSPVAAHPSFTPLGEDAGVYMTHGATQIAYLLCYLRVDAILHARPGAQRQASTSPAAAAGASSRAGDTRRWLSPDFASRLRTQLLDRSIPGQRLAALLPPLVDAGGPAGASRPVPAGLQAHPLPPPPLDATGMFGRVKQLTAP